MSDKRRNIDLLPAHLRTEDLKKFFGSSVDQVFQPGRADSIAGYIGRYPSYFDETTDFYIGEIDDDRAYYQLEPAMVSGDAPDYSLFFPDLIARLNRDGGILDNQNRALSGKYYSWAPPIDIDKITNPQQYLWFGSNPYEIPVLVLVAQYEVHSYRADRTYAMPPVIDGMPSEKPVIVNNGSLVPPNHFEVVGDNVVINHDSTMVSPGDTDIRVYRYGDLKGILTGEEQFDPSLIADPAVTAVMNSMTTVTNIPTEMTNGMRVIFQDAMHRYEGWESTPWDQLIRANTAANPTDEDIIGKWDATNVSGYLVDGVGESMTFQLIEEYWRGPVDPIYVLNERGSVDRNPWSTGNYWIHVDTFKWSGKNFSHLSGKRAIIEFIKNLELYHYGKKVINIRVDGITVSDPVGNPSIAPVGPIMVDGGMLEDNQVILINKNVSDDFLSHSLAIVKETNPGSFILVPYPYSPQDGDIVNVSANNLAYYYESGEWRDSQPYADHVPPLFRLYNANHEAKDLPEGNNFTGCRLFGYADGDVFDPVLKMEVELDKDQKHIFDNYIETQDYRIDDILVTGISLFRNNVTGEYGSDWHSVEERTYQVFETNYSIPRNLQANPNNGPVRKLTRNEWFDHFTNLMDHQVGFEGETYGANNYRDTPRDLSLGDRIIQHRASLLKTMLMASSEMFNLPAAIRKTDTDYNRFRALFIQRVAAEVTANPRNQNTTTASWLNETFVVSILNAMKIHKTADMPYALSRVGGGQFFIPPTPTAMGIFEPVMPEMIVDSSYGEPIEFIRGHDGSLTPLMGEMITFIVDQTTDFVLDEAPMGMVMVFVDGVRTTAFDVSSNIVRVNPAVALPGQAVTISVDDPRDVALLVLERMIYQAIPTRVREAHRQYNDTSFRLSAFRKAFGYTPEEISAIQAPMFTRWAQLNHFDYRTNNVYDQNNPMTFNYNGCTNYLGEIVTQGHWRAINRYFYDTETPNSTPWECLGFRSKPDWWESFYGVAPYTSTNSDLWDDIREGRIRSGIRAGVDENYVRTGVPIPVDAGGNLLDPMASGLLIDAPSMPSADWNFGDGANVEAAWRQSPSFEFAETITSYLTRPPEFVETFFDTQNIGMVYDQWLDFRTMMRPQNSNLVIHGDRLPNGTRVEVPGLQQWVVEMMIDRAQDTLVFSDAIRAVDVKLAHRMGGFTTADDMRIVADNFGLIPSEDITLSLYESPPKRSTHYSGVIIENVGFGWRVVGYDVLRPFFDIIPSDTSSSSFKISALSENEAPIPQWKVGVFYRENTMVAYENLVYRATADHMAAGTFETAYWEVIRGKTVPVDRHVVGYTEGLDQIIRIPYGTILRTRQEVADFLIGHQRKQVSDGWVFETMDDNGELVDWVASVKQFLVWDETDWAEGNILALSPLALLAPYVSEFGNILPVEDTVNGSYGIVNRSGMPISPRDTYVSRMDDRLEVSISEGDLYGIRLTINEVEHAIYINNKTRFGDIVYDPLFDIRQPRLKMFAILSKNWAGRMDAPGFVVDDNTMTPNFDKAAEDIRYMFDIEGADNKLLRDYARHNVGFESRNYMDDLLLSEVQQFEFYQGMIQQKGAPGALNKLLRSQFISESRDLLFLEEWAFKRGDFGASLATNRVAFEYLQTDIRRDPQYIVIDGQISYDPTGFVVPQDRFIETPTYNPTDIEKTFFIERQNYDREENDLPNAGFVRSDEVDYSTFNLETLNNEFSEMLARDEKFSIGDRIWLADDGKLSYQVYVLSTPMTIKAIEPVGDNTKIYVDHSFTTLPKTIWINESTDTSSDLAGGHVVTSLGTGWVQISTKINEGYLYDSSLNMPHLNVGENAPTLMVMRETVWDTVADIRDTVVGDIVYVRNYGSQSVAYRQNASNRTVLRRQPRRIDSTRILNAMIYDQKTKIDDTTISPEPLVLGSALIYDPICGMVSGIAEKEIYRKSEDDPARYTGGRLWGSEQVGKLWWDLSKVRYIDPMTNVLGTSTDGDEINYRINNWGKLSNGSVIHVYEWTRSTKHPREFDNGIVYGEDNPKFVERVEFDISLGRLAPVYYFWTRDHVDSSIPVGRNIPLAQVVAMLSSPTDNEIAWFSPVTPNSFVMSGAHRHLNDEDSVLQIEVKRHANQGSRHTEWFIMRNGDERSQPPASLWNKMVDSVAGFDGIGQAVPDPSLHPALKQGISIRPRQSLFSGSLSDRETTLSARRAFFDMANVIMARNPLVDERPNMLADLTSNNIPQGIWMWTEETGPYENIPTVGGDIVAIVTDFDQITNYPVGSKVVMDGRLETPAYWSVWEVSASGPTPVVRYNYVIDTLDELDTLGVVPGDKVLVIGNGDWIIWLYSGVDAQTGLPTLTEVEKRQHNIRKYWEIVDWYADGYSPVTPPVVSYATTQERNNAENPRPISTFVRIDDDGSGRWSWTFYDGANWNTVARENATVRILPSINNSVDQTYHETRRLADIIDRNFTFAEKNELFFSMVSYAHATLDQVNWAFKTSFLYIAGYNEQLIQTPVQINDVTESLISYIEEVKPYRVKIRDFARTLNPPMDTAQVRMIDYDFPQYWDDALGRYRWLSLTNPADLQIIKSEEPWKSWYEVYQRPYAHWPKIGEPGRLVDYDPNYGVALVGNPPSPEPANPIRRIRISAKHKEIDLNVKSTIYGETYLDREPYDFTVKDEGDDHYITEGDALNPYGYNREDGLVKVRMPERFCLTSIQSDKIIMVTSDGKSFKEEYSVGWDFVPWDHDSPRGHGWDSDFTMMTLSDDGYLERLNNEYATVAELFTRDAQELVVDAPSGFIPALANLTARAFLWVGCEKVSYSGVVALPQGYRFTGLVRRVDGTPSSSSRISVFSGGSTPAPVSWAKSDNVQIFYQSGATDELGQLLMPTINAGETPPDTGGLPYAILTDSPNGLTVDVISGIPFTSSDIVLIQEKESEGAPIGTRVIGINT